MGLVALAVLGGCNGEGGNTPPDAGIDDSCGIDCVAQQRYGLIEDTCFEYADVNMPQQFPAIGAWVRKVRELEGGVRVMPLEYRQNGQILMIDNFTIRQGSLYQIRREFRAGQSVTYRQTQAGPLAGVPWLHPDTQAGQNFSESVHTHMVNAGQQSDEPTSWRVNTFEATSGEKNVPQGEFPDAFKMAFTENPPHGKDTTRVFAPGTGFIVFTSTLQLESTTNAKPYFLQALRPLSQDEGECGLPQ
jgi:hypothetical protein